MICCFAIHDRAFFLDLGKGMAFNFGEIFFNKNEKGEHISQSKHIIWGKTHDFLKKFP